MVWNCQLKALPDAGTHLSLLDRVGDRVVERAHFVERNTRQVLADPTVLLRKLRDRIEGARLDPTPPSAAPGASFPPLDLQPGDRVRIKSLEEIRDTLDENGKYRGLSFMSLMADYCGGTYTVRKRIDRFFDERTRRLLKLRGVVILDDVFCEPPRDSGREYAGCDRTCFFFWKEAWLERVAVR